MQTAKEYILNGLLAALVAVSCVLSFRVWFPSEPMGTLHQAPQVQSSPPSQAGERPDVRRPERIYVQNKDGQVALLPDGSAAYGRVWSGLQQVLGSMRTIPVPVDEEAEHTGESITMVLPISLTIQQWADLWHWETGGFRNFNAKVDRLTVYLDKSPAIYLSGSALGHYRLGPVSQAEEKAFQDLVAGLDPGLYQKYRPLTLKDPTLKLSPAVQVPDVSEVPVGTLAVKKPDPDLEQARYFPDLSVMRQIEEKDANSFTDGQRLLRLTADGRVEFLTAPGLGVPPELTKALDAMNEWVSSHGGWPQGLVLSRYAQQPGVSDLVFDLRLDGAFPVESAGPEGAMQASLTRSSLDATTVIQFRRIPDLTPHFCRSTVPVISAEKALQLAAPKFPSLFLFEEVRDMHLAYWIRRADKPGLSADWILEPVWVIQVGEAHVYTAASPLSDVKPFVDGP